MKGVKMLSRKHYRLIAKTINDNITRDTYGDEHIHKDDLINDLCIMFARDNTLFSRSRFVSACNDE
jgi:hypothetical protein